MKTTVSTLLLGLLSGSLIHCSGGGNKSGANEKTNMSRCTESEMSLAKVTQAGKATEIPAGEFRLEKIEVAIKKSGEELIMNGSIQYDQNNDQVAVDYRRNCQTTTNLTSFLIEGDQYGGTIPTHLMIDEIGYLEPARPLGAQLQIYVINNKVDTNLTEDKPVEFDETELNFVRVAMTKLRDKLVPYEDGFILYQNNEENGETFSQYYFYKRISKKTAAQPQVIAEPLKTSCLEQTQFNLGSYEAQDLRFSEDCKQVSVQTAKTILEVQGSAPGSLDQNKFCPNEYNGVTLNAYFVMDRQAAADELQVLNPNVTVRPANVSNPKSVRYLKIKDDSRFIIPTINYQADGDHTIVEFNGAIAAQVELKGQPVCETAELLKDLKNNKKEIADYLIKYFDIQF
jgi:hypothetical protein